MTTTRRTPPQIRRGGFHCPSGPDRSISLVVVPPSLSWSSRTTFPLVVGWSTKRQVDVAVEGLVASGTSWMYIGQILLPLPMMRSAVLTPYHYQTFQACILGSPGNWRGGLAGLDNPGLEPSKTICDHWTLVWRRQSGVHIGAVGMAATRDNGHVDEKLLNWLIDWWCRWWCNGRLHTNYCKLQRSTRFKSSAVVSALNGDLTDCFARSLNRQPFARQGRGIFGG